MNPERAGGGTSPLPYRWEGKSANAEAPLNLFGNQGLHSKSVTVADGGGDKAMAAATIAARGPLRQLLLRTQCETG